MTELSVAICDDLAEERAGLARMVQTYCRTRGLPCRVSLFVSGEALLEAYLPSQPFQIIFLDIYMPGASGIETARKLRAIHAGAALIFATTSQEHGMDSFDVHASDYLVKPIQPEEVARALDWCLAHMPEAARRLSVYAEGEAQELPLTSIQYIDVYGHQARIHTAHGVLTIRRGLDALEEAIHSPDFLRCHRSFLVNMNYVQGLEGSDFCMADGARVPISSANLSRLRSRFIDWTYSKAWGQA